jgi:hypothetical protein
MALDGIYTYASHRYSEELTMVTVVLGFVLLLQDMGHKSLHPNEILLPNKRSLEASRLSL